MKTTLIAILAATVLRTPRRPVEPESYAWVAGEIMPTDPGWSRCDPSRYSNCRERFERPRK